MVDIRCFNTDFSNPEVLHSQAVAHDVAGTTGCPRRPDSRSIGIMIIPGKTELRIRGQ
jgi:hypothetical protein